MKAKDLAKLRKRDQHCWHCGAEDDLVPHHRANRGYGGAPSLDVLQNVILVCAQYNGLMESDAKVAEEARRLGHKISKFQTSNLPVFDKPLGKWYFLDMTGGKREQVNPSELF